MLKNYIDNFIKDFHKLKHAYSWESLGFLTNENTLNSS